MGRTIGTGKRLGGIAGQRTDPKHLLGVCKPSNKSNLVPLWGQHRHAAEVAGSGKRRFFRRSYFGVNRWCRDGISGGPPITPKCGAKNKQKRSDSSVQCPRLLQSSILF